MSALSKIPAPYVIGGGLVLLVVGYVFLRGVKGTTKDAVVTLGNIAAGAVEGVGAIVGVPSTNTNQCAIDLAAGNTWAATFSCSAPDLIKGTVGTWFGGSPAKVPLQ